MRASEYSRLVDHQVAELVGRPPRLPRDHGDDAPVLEPPRRDRRRSRAGPPIPGTTSGSAGQSPAIVAHGLDLGPDVGRVLAERSPVHALVRSRAGPCRPARSPAWGSPKAAVGCRRGRPLAALELDREDRGADRSNTTAAADRNRCRRAGIGRHRAHPARRKPDRTSRSWRSKHAERPSTAT